MGMALNEISRRSLSRRELLFEACICLPCALTVEPSIIIIIIVAGCSTLAMRSCFDALMMISSPAIGSSRCRCKCRGSIQALLASWALLPLTPHAAPSALPLTTLPHCLCHTPSPTPAPSAPPMRSLHARILTSRSWDRCRRPHSAQLTGTLNKWSSYANTRSKRRPLSR